MNRPAVYPPITKTFMPIDGDYVHIPKLTDVQSGSQIMAVLHGHLVHAGQVTDVMPSMGVFWIHDNIRGGRRVIFWDEFKIFGRPDTSTDPVVKADNQ